MHFVILVDDPCAIHAYFEFKKLIMTSIVSWLMALRRSLHYEIGSVLLCYLKAKL